MIVGQAPLRFVRNQLRCGCCDEQVPGSCAGADIAADYTGPVLTGVAFELPDGEQHRCGTKARRKVRSAA